MTLDELYSRYCTPNTVQQEKDAYLRKDGTAREHAQELGKKARWIYE